MKIKLLLIFLFFSGIAKGQDNFADNTYTGLGVQIRSALASADAIFNEAGNQTHSNTGGVQTNKNLKTGLILLGTGVALTGTGLALGISEGGFSYSYSNVNGNVSESGTPAQGCAGTMVCCGSASFLGGLVFTAIGYFGKKK